MPLPKVALLLVWLVLPCCTVAPPATAFSILPPPPRITTRRQQTSRMMSPPLPFISDTRRSPSTLSLPSSEGNNSRPTENKARFEIVPGVMVSSSPSSPQQRVMVANGAGRSRNQSTATTSASRMGRTKNLFRLMASRGGSGNDDEEDNLDTGVPSNSRSADTAGSPKKKRKRVQTLEFILEDDDAPTHEQDKMWRVVLHNDEVHTMTYVREALVKTIPTLDKRVAHEICAEAHGIGKATATKTWKTQAAQYCLGLQRRGLTASIAPDEDFENGHSGGGL